MKAGFRGTFVISWSQTRIDGLRAAPMDALSEGAAWAWDGDPVRVDGPSGILRLDQADGEASLRKRAARTVRRLVGAAIQNRTDIDAVDVDEPLMDSNFVVTDGVQSYTVTVIEVGAGSAPLLMFLDQLPPKRTDLWVVHHALGSVLRGGDDAGLSGVICFTKGTVIATESGPTPVEALSEGDRILTRDNGPQEILWTASRRITGARMFVMPHLRPVRISTGALGIDVPDQDLLVSPDHRVLVRGPAARALFNTSEVLVPAVQLVNGAEIRTDLDIRHVTYYHLMLPSHQVIWANGVESESFHPAGTSLSTLSEVDRIRLLAQFPELEHDPHLYGAYARRSLSASETAILMHDAA